MKINQKKWLLGCVLIVILAMGFKAWQQLTVTDQSVSITQAYKELRDHQKVALFFADNSQKLTVEVVNTPASVTQGLSDRDSLGSDGMLFIFPTATQQVFWMKNMHFDLDLVWINQGRIVGITTNVPKPPNLQAPLDTLPHYRSPGLVDMVLELNAGRAQELGLTTQQQITLHLE